MPWLLYSENSVSLSATTPALVTLYVDIAGADRSPAADATLST